MNPTSILNGSAEVENALQRADVVKEALARCGLGKQVENLAAHIESARNMRFAIGVVGQAKRGKSTLINAILGRADDTMAPVDRFPATNVVSCFVASPMEDIKVIFDAEGIPPKPISASDIKHYACEEFNPRNQKGVKVIEVKAPFAGLGDNVVLVDTPGADNALSNVHDIVLMDCLPRLDAVIFLVAAHAPLTDSELALLRAVRKNDVKKLLFAISMVDKVEPEELSEAVGHNQRVLAQAGFASAPIFTISAKNYQKKEADDGTERLLHAVRELIGEGRAKTIAERLTDITERTAREARDGMTAELELSLKTIDEVRLEKSELEALRNKISREGPALEREFRSKWREAWTEFDDALPGIEKQLRSEYNELIEQTSIAKLDALGKTVHSDVLKRLDEVMEPHAEKLRSSLTAATRKLGVDYGVRFGLAPGDINAITTNKDMLKGGLDVAASGVPSVIGAIAVGSLPGWVAAAIAASAPSAPAVTGIHAFFAGLAGITVGGTSVVAATALAPFAAVGAPLLMGYAGLKVIYAYKGKKDQTRNEISLALKNMIVSVIAETRRNVLKLKDKTDDILANFNEATSAKLDEYSRRTDDLIAKRPDPEQLRHLTESLKIVQRLEAPKAPPTSNQATSTERLFEV